MKPRTCYLICGTPRCGSSLLAEALGNTGVAGYPAEYFWHDDEALWAKQWGLTRYSYADYLSSALRFGTTPNGVFGAKMMWHDYFDAFLRKIRSLPGHDLPDSSRLLTHLFPGLRYIWLSRRDKVGQGVSHWKALQTGGWGDTGDTSQQISSAHRYDFEAIHHLVRRAATGDAGWEAYFRQYSIHPCKVVYEDLVGEYEPTIVRILDFLGVPAPESLGTEKRRLRKQADVISEAWVHRYLHTVSE